MKQEEIEIVYEAIEKFGDSFWNDTEIYLDDKSNTPVIVSNKHLFDDIIKYIKQAGYDLKLVKLET